MTACFWLSDIQSQCRSHFLYWYSFRFTLLVVFSATFSIHFLSHIRYNCRFRARFHFWFSVRLSVPLYHRHEFLITKTYTRYPARTTKNTKHVRYIPYTLKLRIKLWFVTKSVSFFPKRLQTRQVWVGYRPNIKNCVKQTKARITATVDIQHTRKTKNKTKKHTFRNYY